MSDLQKCGCGAGCDFADSTTKCRGRVQPIGIRNDEWVHACDVHQDSNQLPGGIIFDRGDALGRSIAESYRDCNP
jgi:hypothetical protein